MKSLLDFPSIVFTSLQIVLSMVKRLARATGAEFAVMRRTALSILFCGIASFPLRQTAFPQGEATSAIVGQVTDATNTAIPGALMTITNRESGMQHTARTGK